MIEMDEIKNEMEKSLDALKKELVRVRTGRASSTLLDAVMVDYYGSEVPIAQVSNVTTPDARTIQIVPWEQGLMGAIEKAILAANLGFTPQNDGKMIRIPMPAMTEERRKEMVKLVKKIGEDARISVRNRRRDANDQIKKFEKSKEISSDDSKRSMTQVQDLTDKMIKEVDQMIVAKEKEIMTV